jgi:uncharacterized membrane protein YcaP (DUF421 family)
MDVTSADWLRVLAPDKPLLELVARASIIYFAFLIVTRVMPRRTGGELAMMDLIFVLLVAEAAARTLGDYESIADGLVVIATLIGWNYLINALSYHVPLVERLVAAPPLQVIRDGVLLRRNMRREFLSEEELMAHLREEGLSDVAQVASAHIEGDGKISVVPKSR